MPHQDRLRHLELVEQVNQVLNCSRDREWRRARLAVTAHVPGQHAEMLADQRQGGVPLVMVYGGPMGEDHQRGALLTSQPVMDFESIPLEKTFSQFHADNFL